MSKRLKRNWTLDPNHNNNNAYCNLQWFAQLQEQLHKLRCEWSTIDHNLGLALLNFIASWYWPNSVKRIQGLGALLISSVSMRIGLFTRVNLICVDQEALLSVFVGSEKILSLISPPLSIYSIYWSWILGANENRFPLGNKGQKVYLLT